MGWGGCLFEAGRLLTFSAFRMGANSRLGAYSNKYGIFMSLSPIFLYFWTPKALDTLKMQYNKSTIPSWLVG